MDVGHVVCFPSQKYPFLVETEPCLDLQCSCRENASTTKYLLQAWVRRCSRQFAEYRRRYDSIKVIGARSFPSLAKTQPPPETPARSESLMQIDAAHRSMGEPRDAGWASESRVRRNDPCPCGSGRKFKRCCARRLTTNG